MADQTDWPYHFDVLDRDLLYVDKRYQRPLSSFAKQIAARFDPAMFGSLVVSQRPGRKPGKYSLVDGQSRVYGAEQNDVSPLPCLIYTLTAEQEAELFGRLQTERRGMATWIRFRSQLVAKKPETIAIAALVRSTGWKMAGDEDEAGIKSIAAVERLYRRDPELLRRVLDIVRAAWSIEPSSPGKSDPRTRSEILRGIGRFIWERERDGKAVKDDRLVTNLATLTPDQLRHRANALREGAGSSGNYDYFIAEALTSVYAMTGPRSRIAA